MSFQFKTLESIHNRYFNKILAKILTIFGSTGGNTELVVDKVTEILESKGHQVDIRRAEESSYEDFKDHDLYLLASPTYGHGVLQHEFQKLADQSDRVRLDVHDKTHEGRDLYHLVISSEENLARHLVPLSSVAEDPPESWIGLMKYAGRSPKRSW